MYFGDQEQPLKNGGRSKGHIKPNSIGSIDIYRLGYFWLIDELSRHFTFFCGAGVRTGPAVGLCDPLTRIPTSAFSSGFSTQTSRYLSSRSVTDPHVFGPHGSGSISQRYGSGPGYFCQLAKIVRKTLIPTVLWLLLDFLSLKNDVQ